MKRKHTVSSPFVKPGTRAFDVEFPEFDTYASTFARDQAIRIIRSVRLNAKDMRQRFGMDDREVVVVGLSDPVYDLLVTHLGDTFLSDVERDEFISIGRSSVP